MKKKQNLPYDAMTTLILMGITCMLITVTCIPSGQSFVRIMPLYISLIISFLQSRVNRLAPLLGGINSLLYAAVYVYYQLYASALYSVLVSCPLQIVTFLHWRGRAYGSSVRFRRMTAVQRILTAAAFAVSWIVLYVTLSAIGSSYLLLDNTATLLGVFITVLTLLAFIEYTWLMLPNIVIQLALYIVMLQTQPEQLPYLIYTVYAFVCSTMAFVNARLLYREQINESKGESV